MLSTDICLSLIVITLLAYSAAGRSPFGKNFES